MIVHVFTAERFHLVPTMLKGFLMLEEKQFFLLARNNSDEKDIVYNDIFKERRKKNYVITHSFKELKGEAKKYKNEKIVLHGVPYKWMIFYHLNGFKDVNWVCWGAGSDINRSNWKSILVTPLKRMIYQRFKRFGVLMPGDSESLNRNFGLNKAHLLSYFSGEKFPYEISHIKEDERKKELKNIYFGNNSSCIKTYLNLAFKLKKYKNKIRIICMVNYSFTESSTSLKLRETGREIFKDKFTLDTTLYSRNEYYDYMDKCDIYVCSLETQTGLGAIYTCLRLGKKLFLAGKNFEYAKSLGCIVYQVDEIDNMGSEEFLKSLNYEEKVHNYNVIDSYKNEDRVIGGWRKFLST